MSDFWSLSIHMFLDPLSNPCVLQIDLVFLFGVRLVYLGRCGKHRPARRTSEAQIGEA